MEPIISPWFFYWVSLLKGCAFVFIVFAMVSSCAAFACAMFAWVCTDANPDDQKMAKRGFKILLPITILFMFLAVFTPTEKTMYRMLIASHATPQNIEKVIELADKLKDGIKQDVIDVIKEVKDAN